MLNPILLASCLLLTSTSATTNFLESSPLSYNNITSTLDLILARGYLKVGTTGDYKPFTYKVTNRTALPATPAINTTFIGADIDMAQSLSNSLGLPNPVDFVPTAWSNLSSDLSAGKFDVAMGGVSITLLRAQKFFFSTPIMEGGKAACVRCSNVTKFSSLSAIDTAGVKVVVNPGGTNEAFDRANLRNAEIIVVQDNNAVFQAVIDGDADVMITDLIEVELQTRLHPEVLCLAGSNKTFTFEEKAYMVGRDVVWKEYVGAFLHIALGSGAWNQTLEKWMEYKWPSV
ncbi:periplasmic binding protein-like II [Phaeosphaeriaceae sp. SRC1lsM3a]|nr:periplasmic binding protein-like II [Stagonospora sp. SRC1lsM3a]